MSNNCIIRTAVAAALADPYWNNVSSLIHFDSWVNGTNNLRTYTDQQGHSWQTYGTPNTSITAFGTGSIYLDGSQSQDVETSGGNSAFAMGTGDFTWELWVRPSNFNSRAGLMGINAATGTNGLCLTVGQDGNVIVAAYGGTVGSGNIPLTANTWSHVAITRSGSTLTIWVNGKNAGAYVFTWTLSDTAAFIGKSYYGYNAYYFTGYIDEVRITKGVARYTAAFTVPNVPFPNA